MDAVDHAGLEQRILDDFILLVALKIAFRSRVPQRMLQGPMTAKALGWQPDATRRLMAMLASGGLVQDADGLEGWELSQDFKGLLEARGDALASRVGFTAMAAADLLTHGDAWLHDTSVFTARAATFGFFDYGRASGTNAAALEDSAPWVSYVTALTEFEAPRLAPALPLEGCSSLLEIGGNTGAMALETLAVFPGLEAVVMDLPAVCHLGERHVSGHPCAPRLRFAPGDAQRDPWPDVGTGPAEAVLFKSVLHDWSAEAATRLLTQAAAYLPPGGRIVVVERGLSEDEPDISGMAIAADLVFAPFYRRPEWYEETLRDLGLHVRETRHVEAGMTFHIVWAERA